MKSLSPDVTVNGEIIASAAIAAEAQNHAAPKNDPDWPWTAAARSLVIRALLLQEAGRLGLVPEPRMVDGDKMEADDEALIRAVMEQQLEPQEVGDAACRVIYDSRPNAFRSPSLYQPAHILFAARPEDKKARDKARKNAAVFIETIQNAPKTFADIAKSHSDCPSKDAGGTLGQIDSGDTVAEFEAVLDILPAGELHPEPVETQFGIHIIRMDEKAEGAVLPFEAVKVQIKEKLEQIAWTTAAKDLTENLVSQASISGIDLSEPTGKAA